MGDIRSTWQELPDVGRSAVVGAVVLGFVGSFVGLLVGWRVYAPTAWAAAFEVGIPAGLLGAVFGLATGFIVRAQGRSKQEPADRFR